MKFTIVNTTEDALIKFKSDPNKRDCYTENELFFKHMDYADGFRYSMKNCLYESVFEVIIEECNCIPAFANFEVNVHLPICRGHDLKCALYWMDNFGNPNVDHYDLTSAKTNETFVLETKKCLERCESQQHTIMATSTSYPDQLTFPFQLDFCLILKKIVERTCIQHHRKMVFEKKYYHITCKEISDAYNGPTRYVLWTISLQFSKIK